MRTSFGGLNAGRIHARRWLWSVVIVCLIVPTFGGVADAGVTAGDVAMWDQFEGSVANGRSYANPYSDVLLDVTYTRPNGSKITFGGFYDGGTTWRFRMMCDQLGAWQYSATFSDGSPGTSGSFNCVSGNIPGMLSAHQANPLWFGFTGGTPEMIRSFHVGDRFFAKNWDDPLNPNDGNKRKVFLDWAQQQGYNTLSVASHYLKRNSPGRGDGWDLPVLWEGTTQRPQAGEYREMEVILDDLAQRKMLVYPFAGFFGKESDAPTDSSKQDVYVRYTLARVAPYWNILLNVGGPELLGLKTQSEINRIGQLIETLDVFRHPRSVHNQKGNDPFLSQSWETYVTLQGPKTTNLATLSSGLLANHGSKPLYAQETLWSGNQHHGNYTDTQLRQNAYVINMSAAALNFADNDPNLTDGPDGNSSSGFTGTMNLSDRLQGRHDIIKKVWDFFETVPFYRMKPRQDLVSRGYALAEPGATYLVYLPTGDSVDVSVTSGTYGVTWINASNTTDRRSGGTTSTGDNLTAPNSSDWLLYLVSTDEEPPPPPPPPPPSSRTLVLSNSADRSSPAALEGQTVDDNIYVFVSPWSDIKRVSFYVDDPTMSGTPYKTESGAPHDLAGTASNGSANPFDTTGLSDGAHNVTAKIELSAGGTEVDSADFTVANGSEPPPPPPPPPPPSGRVATLSTSPDRSSPAPLEGQTVQDDIYVFVSPWSDIKRVSFYVDDPTMSGTPYRSEGVAPHDLAGTASNGNANPYDSTALADGAHNVTVKIELSAGGTEVDSADFTVANGSEPPPPPPPPPPPSGNLLTNPGFESDKNGWENGTAGTIVATPVHTGAKALQLAASASSKKNVYQEVAVTPGRTYDVSGWLSVDGVAGGAELRLYWQRGGTVISIHTIGTEAKGTTNWEPRSASFTAPPDATLGRIALWLPKEADGAGKAWFDDLLLAEQ